jgi:hypothetical protein
MAASSRAWYLQKGNIVIILCLLWILTVFYTSAPFLIDKNSASVMSWVGIGSGSNLSIGDEVEKGSAAGSTSFADILTTTFDSINGHGISFNNHHHNHGKVEILNNATIATKLQQSDDDIDDHQPVTQNYYTSRDYMRKRIQFFHSWFQGNDTNKLFPNADENGTILDFAIVGFPKCGTTTVEANLGYLAPMPIEDICTPVHQTVWYAYKNWPKEYQKQGEEDKLWRGTKCPAFIQGEWLISWSEYLPRTKLIVGVRHPVLWFQSFWNMQVANHLTKFAGDDPYKIMKPCPNANGKGCRNGCPNRQLLCMHRGRFHVALASLGKTEMSPEERTLLASNDPDGGENVPNHGIRNPIFVYEQTMLGEEYLWKDMAAYLGSGPIKHDKRVNSHGKNRTLEIDFCHDLYDAFRAEMMPISYEVATWLQIYLLPLARNKSRTDVVVANPDEFYRLVEKYKEDPCGKLRRHSNGTFYKHVT